MMLSEKFLHFRPLTDEIDFHIRDGKTLDTLPEDAVDRLVALCMRNPRIDPVEFITESHRIVLTEMVADTIRALEQKQASGTILKETARQYFHSTLCKLFEKRAEIMEEEKNWDAGLVPYTDDHTGETLWRKGA